MFDSLLIPLSPFTNVSCVIFIEYMWKNEREKTITIRINEKEILFYREKVKSIWYDFALYRKRFIISLKTFSFRFFRLFFKISSKTVNSDRFGCLRRAKQKGKKINFYKLESINKRQWKIQCDFDDKTCGNLSLLAHAIP